MTASPATYTADDLTYAFWRGHSAGLRVSSGPRPVPRGWWLLAATLFGFLFWATVLLLAYAAF